MATKLPCINCICLAMCKQKYLRGIFYNCKLIVRYWRLVNLRPSDEASIYAIDVVQELNRYLDREFMPSYINTQKGERFGILDISALNHDHRNEDTILRTYKDYYLNQDIDLLEYETIADPLRVILEGVPPFPWKWHMEIKHSTVP